MRLQEAQRIAGTVAGWLARGCDQLAIVGSVRREKPEVKDIEIAAMPRRGRVALRFGLPAKDQPQTPLDELLLDLKGAGRLALDPVIKRNGPKYRRYVLPEWGCVFELFIGNTVAIRTGDKDFTTLLVTSQTAGGLMPPGYCQRDGYLQTEAGERVPCPDEAAFFAALGVPWVEPRERNAATAAHLVDARRAGR